MRFQSKGLPLQRKTNIDTMVINLIAFASMLHPETTVRRCHEIILAELEKYFTVRLVDYREMSRLKPDDFALVFIATGGVERLVIQHFEHLPRPVLLLADLLNDLVHPCDDLLVDLVSLIYGIDHDLISDLIRSCINLFDLALKNVNGSRPLSSSTSTFVIERPLGELYIETLLIYPNTVVVSPSFKRLMRVLEE